MTKLLLGLDAGNTVVKAVLFDLAGRSTGQRGCTLREGRSRQPAPRYVERDIAELWRDAAG